MRAGILVAALIAIASVSGGVLLIDSDAPRTTILWLQGVERANVYYVNQEVYRHNMTLLTGPNQCFTIGADGNDRAILIEPESDDRGPHQPDAIVDCRVCGCEDEPGTRYTCGSDGRCQSCDPCSTTTCNAGEVCIRNTCTDATCACDPILCSQNACDERVSVVSRCESDRCVSERSCIEGACGSECTSGETKTRVYCEDTILMRELSSCSDTCTLAPRVSVIADCSDMECPIGTMPQCAAGGCRCL